MSYGENTIVISYQAQPAITAACLVRIVITQIGNIFLVIYQRN